MTSGGCSSAACSNPPRKGALWELLEAAQLSGVAQSNMGADETGPRSPSSKTLARLAEAATPRPSVALAKHRTRVKALAKRHRAIEVKVFGSVARLEDAPGSDLDLLVRFAPDATLFDQIELANDIEALIGVQVDVVSEATLNGPRHAHIANEQPSPT